MMNFEKQSEIMDMKQEMQEDAIDEAFADDEDEEEEEAIVGAVLEEIGISAAEAMGGVPSGAPASASAVADESSLQARLNNP